MTRGLQGTVAIVAVPAGAELARRLAGAGAAVVLTGSGGEEVGHLVAELEESPGRVAHFHSDLASDDEIEALVEFVAEQLAKRPPVS